MSFKAWILWAFVLILQNFAFTFVSRARNSGSLKRHVVAAFASNGVWFASQLIILGNMLDIITGKRGALLAVLTGLYYTAFTLSGSLLAHWYSLKSEKGAGAVGASKKYHQVTAEEWAKIRRLVALDESRG